MSYVGGIDLGGTKIEAQLFNENWDVVDVHRIPTPQSGYEEFLDGIEAQIQWLQDKSSTSDISVGIGIPGLIDAATGLAFTANIPASQKPLPADVALRVGRPIHIVNDVRAFVASEAVLGAGKGLNSVVGLILGTGVAGGWVIGGSPATTRNGLGGEVGHCPIPYPVMIRHRLPSITCGCGREACYETFLAGPGLERLSDIILGEKRSPKDIATGLKSGDADAERVFSVWLDIAASLIDLVMMTYDPDCIVLGGGLSHLPDLTSRLATETVPNLLPGVTLPPICLAQGGDSSGARGAAWLATREGAGS